jgi:uncharacterized protein
MQAVQPGKILRIHISESDRYQGKPRLEAIVAKCRDLHIAGATVFQGLEGYGESAEMHRAHLVRHDQPIVIVIADTAENLDLLIPTVEARAVVIGVHRPLSNLPVLAYHKKKCRPPRNYKKTSKKPRNRSIRRLPPPWPSWPRRSLWCP